jgi:hypothetical protein
MCNHIRGLKEWSEIPRSLTRSLINFEYNPNVAPTEQVPAFLAERGKPLATRMARFGINHDDPGVGYAGGRDLRVHELPCRHRMRGSTPASGTASEPGGRG